MLLLIMLVTFFMALDLQYTELEGRILLGSLAAMIIWLVKLGTERPPSDRFAEELEAEIPTDVPTRIAIFWLAVSLISAARLQAALGHHLVGAHPSALVQSAERQLELPTRDD